MSAVLLVPILFLGLAHTPAFPAADAQAGAVFRQDRVYSLERLNGRAVPADVEFAATGGSRHWVRMEEAVLRLRRDGTFVASAKFYRELLQAGRRPPALASVRLLNDGTNGRYFIRGDTVVLNVPKRRDTAASTVYARINGDRLRVRQTLRDGNIRHNVDIVLKVDSTIW